MSNQTNDVFKYLAGAGVIVGAVYSIPLLIGTGGIVLLSTILDNNPNQSPAVQNAMNKNNLTNVLTLAVLVYVGRKYT